MTEKAEHETPLGVRLLPEQAGKRGEHESLLKKAAFREKRKVRGAEKPAQK